MSEVMNNMDRTEAARLKERRAATAEAIALIATIDAQRSVSSFTDRPVPLCAQMNLGDIWFPGKGKRHDTTIAKKICESCEIREECLEKGIEGNEVGIWGGTSENERRKIRKARGYNKPRSDSM